MKELVQTFYDLSILDAEQITPRREDFNLSNLLINLISENAPALEAKIYLLKLICRPILSISILITAWWKGFYKIF